MEAEAQTHAARAEATRQEIERADELRRHERERADDAERHRLSDARAAQALADSEMRHRTLAPQVLRTASVPPAARVKLEGLAALVLRLAELGATGRLELRSDDALRVLWLDQGHLAGAASSAPGESLLERAHRDGLVDARQTRELRLLRAGTDAELLRGMLERGYLRESEAVPLLQRATEHVALEALSELDAAYRWTLGLVVPESERAAALRPLRVLAVEALRRGLSTEAVIERTQGLQAVPSLVVAQDFRLLGFPEREAELLESIDGESTVQSLLLGVGLKQDTGLRALALAQALGAVTFRIPESANGHPVAAERDVERLVAKWQETEEADYFTVLGLTRAAGRDEVTRAFASLSEEFHPLRFVGHPDPALQHRAQQLQSLFAEAAQALADDQLRSRYARSLVD